ncbi:hypothetical protein CaCOL14_005160 [Colletotrichum acutatum]
MQTAIQLPISAYLSCSTPKAALEVEQVPSLAPASVSSLRRYGKLRRDHSSPMATSIALMWLKL